MRVMIAFHIPLRSYTNFISLATCCAITVLAAVSFIGTAFVPRNTVFSF